MADWPKMTKRERIDYAFLADAMRQLEWDLRHPQFLRMRIPPEWHEIAKTRSFAKTRITMRVDTEVVRFFRGLGPGYQAKMNEVLRAFVRGRLAGLIEGPESLDYIREGIETDELGIDRPEQGDSEREMRKVRGE